MPKRRVVGPRGLGLSFKALARSGNPSRPPTNRRTRVPPLLALPACPLHCSTVRASTPECSEERSSGRRYHPTTSCSTLVVSHHLGGFLCAAAAGLLHPAASHEVRRVSCGARPDPSEDVLATARDSRDSVHTLQRVPLVSSRTASLRPLPSYRFTSIPSPTARFRHKAESVFRAHRRGGQPVVAWTGRRPKPTSDCGPPKRTRRPHGTPKRLAEPASPKRSAARIRGSCR